MTRHTWNQINNQHEGKTGSQETHGEQNTQQSAILTHRESSTIEVSVFCIPVLKLRSHATHRCPSKETDLQLLNPLLLLTFCV